MDKRNEIVCFECMEGNHPECNGDHERCDCWECLEHEVYDGPDDYEGEDD